LLCAQTPAFIRTYIHKHTDSCESILSYLAVCMHVPHFNIHINADNSPLAV
jgi:hypothetical protein